VKFGSGGICGGAFGKNEEGSLDMILRDLEVLTWRG
jgi:hypothetical protein